MFIECHVGWNAPITEEKNMQKKKKTSNSRMYSSFVIDGFFYENI